MLGTGWSIAAPGECRFVPTRLVCTLSFQSTPLRKHGVVGLRSCLPNVGCRDYNLSLVSTGFRVDALKPTDLSVGH